VAQCSKDASKEAGAGKPGRNVCPWWAAQPQKWQACDYGLGHQDSDEPEHFSVENLGRSDRSGQQHPDTWPIPGKLVHPEAAGEKHHERGYKSVEGISLGLLEQLMEHAAAGHIFDFNGNEHKTRGHEQRQNRQELAVSGAEDLVDKDPGQAGARGPKTPKTLGAASGSTAWRILIHLSDLEPGRQNEQHQNEAHGREEKTG
jgi:hypothetical protein